MHCVSSFEKNRPSAGGRGWVKGATLGALLLHAPAWAELPEYTFQLQARTNLEGNASGAYNLAPGNLLPGGFSIPLTADRKVGFVLSVTPEGRRAIWYGGDGEGSRIYMLPDVGVDAILGELSLNSRAQAAFTVTGANAAENNGIYLLDVTAPDAVQVLRAPLGSTSWSSLVLNEAGQMGARVSMGTGKVHVLYVPRDGGGFEAKILASEKSVDASSPYTFLYSPNLNDEGQMVGVVDLASPGAEYFQELRVWSADGTSQLVAESRGQNPLSPVWRFASVQPSLNNQGQVAFLATVKNASNQNRTALLLWDGTALKTIAQDGVGDIKTVEFFPADLNDSGLVVFRAIRASDGLRAVWVSDGSSLKPVVVEHDILPSDLGEARVDQETASNPVFGGNPRLNARGDVSFAAGLAPPDNNQEEWGTAVYVALSSLPLPGGTDGGVETPDAGVETPDAGEETPDAGEETPDAGVEAPDAGVETPDAGAEAPDAGSTFNPPPMTVIPGSEAEAGCGCQSTSPAALWPWALAGLVGLSRRLSVRRRERSARD